MEKVKGSSLKREFFAAVTAAIAVVALASALTVWGCWALRRWLVPDASYVELRVNARTEEGVRTLADWRCRVDGGEQPLLFLENTSGAPGGGRFGEGSDPGEITFSVSSVDYGIGRNGPRRRAAYIAAGAAMGVLPAVYAAAGTSLCAVWFYRKRLAPGIAALDDAAARIGGQDLDFTVECPLRNELGRLCHSFEGVRRTLYDNNLRLWRAVEERRTLQRSVAHDLRNPLAILEGIVERTRESAARGELTEERLASSLEGLDAAARRMERYTDYIRDLDVLEDTEVNRTETPLPDFLREAAKSVYVLVEGRGLATAASYDVPPCRVRMDREIFYRVLENVVSNAVRYAKTRVTLDFSLQGETLRTAVTDDGPGFSEEMLRQKEVLRRDPDPTGEHRGLGLAAGRILCGKHGGAIKLANSPTGGAVVNIAMEIEREEKEN